MNNFDLEKVKSKTLTKYPLFGSIIANTQLIITSKIKTAGTEGKKIYFNSEFMSSLTQDEQIFVFAHEICHLALNHIKRGSGKDKKTWNKATDAVINANLENDGLTMPSCGIRIFGAINHDAEELYEKLLKEKQKQGFEDEEEPNFDNHDIWEEENSIFDDLEDDIKDDKDNEEQKENILKKILKKLKKESKISSSNSQKSNKNQDNEDEIYKISEQGEKKAFENNKEQRQRNLEEMLKRLSNEESSFCRNTSLQEINVGNVGSHKSIIDWRLLLREAVNFDVDWSYLDAEVEYGVIIPHLHEYPLREAEIVLDTSGSIDDELLRCFLRECKNILEDSIIKVGCFDTKFYGFEEIRMDEDIENMTFKGRGGTDFNAAVNAFSDRVENKIIFTDGKANMPTKAVNAIWVVFGDKKINPPGGRVINIKEDDLRRMYSFEENITKTR